MLQRRQFLIGGSVTALAAGAGVGTATLLARTGPAPVTQTRSDAPLALALQTARFAIVATPTDGLASLAPDAPPPVIRMRQGEPFTAEVLNRLDEYTTLHWHGIRVPNGMDGVPYLTQPPIGVGARFRYTFTPHDAGTYWYHPHCRTMTQMARGLTGVIVVDEPEDPGFDHDLALNLKDFHLDDAARLRPPFSKRGAARGGTLGSVMTVNWRVAPVYTLPAGALVRLRVVATDAARIYRLALDGASGKVIAVDGHPSDGVPWPTPDAPLLLAPGQRVDIALRVPDHDGDALTLAHYAGGRVRPLTTLRASGPSARRELAELRPLAANPVANPQLRRAETREFVFGWTPEAIPPVNDNCGSFAYAFWSINRTPYPGDRAAAGAGPLAVLKRGRSYVLRLRNDSPNAHPIHLHGLTFRLLRSNRRALAPRYTDTVLLLRGETVDIGLVADNPGRWAFHCHVIEHQKTGLAG